MTRLCFGITLLVSIGLATQLPVAAQSQNPKVRAITAFVRLDQDNYRTQISDALIVLEKAKAEFVSSGYEVETVRITTQPLGEMIKGMPEDKALALLRQINDLSVKDNFLPNVGPGMMHDTDDPMPMHLLEQALSTMSNIEGSSIIADEEGIHWKTIHRTAELVKYVSEHSARSEGTSNFTATAMLKPLSPSFRVRITPALANNSPSALKVPMSLERSSRRTKGMPMRRRQT
jgi:hypothetical protein